MSVVLCIDPGLEGTGLAVFTRPLVAAAVIVPRIEGYIVRPVRTATQDVATSIRDMFYAVVEVCDKHAVQKVVIEKPEYWSSSKMGRASANSGALVKLTLLAGSFAILPVPRVQYVTVNQWKGQTPKKVIQKRLLRDTGITWSNHVCDAVGIGMYLRKQGELFD